MISEIDNLESNENDLIFRSGVKFELREEKDYSEEIMELLNYVIALPQ